MFDRFVVTRILNMAGLVFNQRLICDQVAKTRFFNAESMNNWTLSKNNECYVCEKH